MVLARPFKCPTEVFADQAYAPAVRELVGERRWALATSKSWTERGVVDVLTAGPRKPAVVIDRIPENPKVSDVIKLYDELPPVEVVVALGGGSVIDGAKGLVGLRALDGDRVLLMDHLESGAALPAGFAPVPLIAVPTTSGTGSEVTRWATIWGDDKVKFSLTHPALYPAQAVLDPALCVSMPLGVTLASGLDALSHAMEAIWNRNHTPVSDQLAIAAIRRLRAHLPRAVATPEDIEARRQMQTAALMSGLAMGTTQTALAHSISYPFTARFGVPHGFACSFTLAEVARYNAEGDPARLLLVADAFGCAAAELPEAIADWLAELGIGAFLDGFVDPAVADGLGDNLITRARAANNLRDVDGPTARAIARRSLERFCSGGRRVARTAS